MLIDESPEESSVRSGSKCEKLSAAYIGQLLQAAIAVWHPSLWSENLPPGFCPPDQPS